MSQQTEPRTRREAMQRVQFGLIGLAVVLLVVAFANLVTNSLRNDNAANAGGSAAQQAGAASNGVVTIPSPDVEPLADLGLTPKAEHPAAAPAPAPVGPSVPDLEPDPLLSKPMDKDPKKPQGQPARSN